MPFMKIWSADHTVKKNSLRDHIVRASCVRVTSREPTNGTFITVSIFPRVRATAETKVDFSLHAGDLLEPVVSPDRSSEYSPSRIWLLWSFYAWNVAEHEVVQR
ncbi:hypothetical protein MTO96_047249, partial [Rhipicephalus appendiculatus]